MTVGSIAPKVRTSQDENIVGTARLVSFDSRSNGAGTRRGEVTRDGTTQVCRPVVVFLSMDHTRFITRVASARA